MSDTALLEQSLALKEAEITHLKAQVASMQRTQNVLLEQVRLLKAHRFGPSTEKYNVEQKDLFFDEAETLITETPEELSGDDDPAPKIKSRSSRGRRQVLPPELPRVDVVHDLSEEAKQCPEDGASLIKIGEVVSEQLDIIPAQIQVIRHIRIQYACKACEEHVQTADLPPQPIPKSNASPNLLAYILIAKYGDALPLYRQEAIFKRHGLGLPRNTLARWVIQCGELLAPLLDRCRAHLRQQSPLHMDETTVQVNREPGKQASSPSYMWVQRAGPPKREVVLYDYDPSRSGKVPVRLLEGYKGTLVTDGYEGYAAVVRENHLVHAGCWAHARRKFVEAQKASPKGKQGLAEQALHWIGELYQHEKACSENTPEQRQAYRQQHSQATLKQLKKWLDKKLSKVLPKSVLGKALHYLANQWPKLTVFLKDGHVPLDNNAAENAIRPFVVGRKNWLFSETPQGANASATIYSLIETAKLNGIEPQAYLAEVLKRIPSTQSDEELDQLLPWNIALPK